ncbi:MAG: hypothetical protein PHI37_05740 [Candidatus Gracilibacteria bacterium]|nr:hypothetical protein [Candidatus Gracilibacteria bacterium]
MKNIILIIFILFSLTSCGDDFKEAGNIMDDYAGNLETSITDSKEVKELMNQNTDDLKNAIDSSKQ